MTDDQMQELNPIIRNAVCTALHAFNHYEQTDAAGRFVDFNLRMIPKYWEEAELLDDYVQLWDRTSTTQNTDQIAERGRHPD